MARRLARLCLARPAEGMATVRMLRAYRCAQERLRQSGCDGADLCTAQLALAAEHSRNSVGRVSDTVRRWMETEPLDAVAAARHDGLADVLAAARRRGIRLGIVSDYPAAAKLDALQLSWAFDVVVCAQDRDVQRFKPDPRGLQVALDRLRVTPDEALYVGDRPDVDAAAARRAGVGCILVAGGTRPGSAYRHLTYPALAGALDREDL